jgi:hypothetical protein
MEACTQSRLCSKLNSIIAKLKGAQPLHLTIDISDSVNKIKKLGWANAQASHILHKMATSDRPAACLHGSHVIAQLDVNSETSSFVSARHQRIVHRLLCSAGDIVAC